MDLSSTKQGAVPLTGRKLQGLRRLSPDLISKAIDETRAHVTRIGLTFLGTSAFCLLSLLSPDSALLGGSERINVPLAGPVSFFGFVLLGPAVLIVLRVYLQIYVEHSERLEWLARSMSIVRAPMLVPLQNPLIRSFSALIFYLLLPLTMLFFAWKAAVFPAWGSGLLCAAVAVGASHLMLPFKNFSWRSKALLSTGAAIVVAAMIVGSGLVRRPFALSRANLSGLSLVWADFGGTDLSKANLSNADLSHANLRGADLSQANLSNADLRAWLADAYLIGANLSNADLTFAELTRAYLGLANLSSAHLDSANLSNADLRYANLTGADLSNANLSNADLGHANLSDARLIGADLTGAKNLIREQLDKACGNEKTKLPEGLTLKPCN